MGAQDYQEMPGYPKESYALGELTATRKLLCTWDDRYAVYSGFFPATPLVDYKYVGAGSGVAYAISGSIDPFEAELLDGTASDPALTVTEAHYTHAIVTIVFKTPGAGVNIPIQNDAVPGKLISETTAPTNELLRLDNSLFKWMPSGDPVTPAQAPSRQLHGFVWTVTRYKMPLGLPVNILGATNSINLGPVLSLSLGITFPEHTLLYAGPLISRGGGAFVKLETRFLYRASGWNKFWREKSATSSVHGFEEITLINDEPYFSYPEVSFAGLFGTGGGS